MKPCLEPPAFGAEVVGSSSGAAERFDGAIATITLDGDPGDERTDSRDRDEDTDDDRSVVGATSSATHVRDEIGIVVIETALHLIEEALLLL